jgi:hypothetical protein
MTYLLLLRPPTPPQRGCPGALSATVLEPSARLSWSPQRGCPGALSATVLEPSARLSWSPQRGHISTVDRVLTG